MTVETEILGLRNLICVGTTRYNILDVKFESHVYELVELSAFFLTHPAILVENHEIRLEENIRFRSTEFIIAITP